MVFKPASSGNPSADVYIARRRLNDAYARDLYDLWKEKGRAVLEQVAREQPAVIVKCLTLMMPKDLRVESTHSVVGGLSDDQLHAMIHELQERITAKMSGENAKVISAEASPAPTTLPQPTRYRRQPKSSPERLAYAREYKRARKAGNPNAAAVARAAAQAAKTTDEPTPTPAV
jgi:hypothetical protein